VVAISRGSFGEINRCFPLHVQARRWPDPGKLLQPAYQLNLGLGQKLGVRRVFNPSVQAGLSAIITGAERGTKRPFTLDCRGAYIILFCVNGFSSRGSLPFVKLRVERVAHWTK
jgi:hypothetical protein